MASGRRVGLRPPRAKALVSRERGFEKGLARTDRDVSVVVELAGA